MRRLVRQRFLWWLLLALPLTLKGCDTFRIQDECRVSCEKCEKVEMVCSLDGDEREARYGKPL